MSHQINFADFIESDEVRNYIKKTGCELSTEQCVYIVKSSRSLPIEEKLKLYEKLIERNVDGYVTEQIPSLLEFLKKYISVMKRLLEEFKKGGQFMGLYSANIHAAYTDIISGEYSSLNEFLEKALEKESNARAIRINKGPFTALASGQGELLTLFADCNEEIGVTEKEKWIVGNALNSFKPIPIPYKKGDLLTENGEIFCVIAKDFDPKTDEAPYVYSAGYNKVEEYSGIYWNWCRVKTYKGKLKKGEEILLPLSQYLKGKLRIDKLLAYYECLKMKGGIELIVEENDLDMLTGGYDFSNCDGEASTPISAEPVQPSPFKKGDIILTGTDTVCVMMEDFAKSNELCCVDEFTDKLRCFTSRSDNSGDWIRFMGKIRENEEVLVILSKYLKEEITLTEFLSMYEGIMLKQQYENLRFEIPLEAIEKLKDYDCYKNEPLIPKE